MNDSTTQNLITAHKIVSDLVAALQRNGWSVATQNLWQTAGIKRLSAAFNSSPHCDLLIYFVQHTAARLIEKLNATPLSKRPTSNENEWARALQPQLVPAVFVQMCCEQASNLAQLSYPPLAPQQ